jgi:hypothetical protein
METSETIVFDTGSTYAHNEMEFGTWRCSWAYYFNSPTYIRMYQRHIEASEPVEEWDDRNRYHFSAKSKERLSDEIFRANNDMLFLCEKYRPSGKSREVQS